MEKQSVKELKAIARERGIKGYYKMKRAELLEVLGIEESEQPKICQHNRKRYNAFQTILCFSKIAFSAINGLIITKNW